MLLATIGTVSPKMNPMAAGSSDLLKAYRFGIHLKEKEAEAKRALKKGILKVFTHKKKLKGMYDDDVVD